MVNVIKGVLVKCDPAMKQFLTYLSENLIIGSRFILSDLDESHIFIDPVVLPRLQAKVDDLMEKLSFPLVTEDE
ncbi:General transcription factor IIH subunit 5 [Taenia solium]|eukprot:TsM_000527200 transcript=TsM_000527200 gene=TsM_000527200